MDCVLVDYHLPDGTGMDFITSFRRENLSPRAAILLATGQENDEMAEEAAKMGATGSLSKIGLTKDAFIGAILDAVKKSC